MAPSKPTPDERAPNPFESLEVPPARSVASPELRERWVVPLYMKLLSAGYEESDVFDRAAALWPDMTEELTRSLLDCYNWRPRLVGAYLAALREQRPMTELIGRLLLRSDLCYAGRGYCVALARFNTPLATQFLLDYLGYYLTRRDLWYDQDYAMSAIAYLDQRNGTDNLRALKRKWSSFASDQKYSCLDESVAQFASVMARCEAVSARCLGAPPA